ncbi:hypothetical protein V6N11_009405 [Hibiscus sabdariffa]|uniref:Uncharacterized protein n=1 Tax=Hibiscus sabdariffa TaxID=183260 RepID=A0ABR2NSP0_9ROSI
MFDFALSGVVFLFRDVVSLSSSVWSGERKWKPKSCGFRPASGRRSLPKLESNEVASGGKEQLLTVVGKVDLPTGKSTARGAESSWEVKLENTIDMDDNPDI